MLTRGAFCSTIVRNGWGSRSYPKALDSFGHLYSESYGKTVEACDDIIRIHGMSSNGYCDNWANISLEYEVISNMWYGNIQNYVKATVRKNNEMSFDSDGYDNDTNEIWICAPEKEHKDDLEKAVFARLASIATGKEHKEPVSEQCIQWPKWKSVIVHEAIHEYEKKVIKENYTIAGRALHEKYKDRFAYPEKHGESFFTAVADRSDYFGLTPEELVLKI